MHASLARPRKAEDHAFPLLDPRGARVILGTQPGAPVAPIAPSATSLFGPRGACLGSVDGPLLVCDTGHHRLLVWRKAPLADGTPADLVIGQPDFASEGRRLLNVPTGVAFADGWLALADAWNHRVLLWRGVPEAWDVPPKVVLTGGLFWPYGVALHRERLYVADTGNRRLLVWDTIPGANRPADRVLREDMHWPHAFAFAGDRAFIADAGAHRVIGAEHLVREELNMPYGVAVSAGRLIVADTASSRLLGFDLDGSTRYLAGQRSLAEKGDNRWGTATRDSLCWPYGVAACGPTLVVADSGNNRVMLWDLA